MKLAEIRIGAPLLRLETLVHLYGLVAVLSFAHNVETALGEDIAQHVAHKEGVIDNQNLRSH